MSAIKAFAQFMLGLICWVIAPIVLVILLVSQRIYLYSNLDEILLLALFLIGIGLAVFCIRKEKWRWFGIGIAVTLVFHVIGLIVRSGCMPPFLLPFPLSLMSAC